MQTQIRWTLNVQAKQHSFVLPHLCVIFPLVEPGTRTPGTMDFSFRIVGLFVICPIYIISVYGLQRRWEVYFVEISLVRFSVGMASSRF